MDQVFTILGNVIYLVMFFIALWGAFCVVMVWARVRQEQFKNEALQTEFLEDVEEPLLKGDYDLAIELIAGDRRATCQLAQLAIENRKIGSKAKINNKIKIFLFSFFFKNKKKGVNIINNIKPLSTLKIILKLRTNSLIKFCKNKLELKVFVLSKLKI